MEPWSEFRCSGTSQAVELYMHCDIRERLSVSHYARDAVSVYWHRSMPGTWVVRWNCPRRAILGTLLVGPSVVWFGPHQISEGSSHYRATHVLAVRPGCHDVDMYMLRFYTYQPYRNSMIVRSSYYPAVTVYCRHQGLDEAQVSGTSAMN